MSVKIPCDHCSRTYDTLQAKEQHVMDSHKDRTATPNMASSKPPQTGSGRFDCSFCNRSFVSEEFLSQHMRDKHKQVSPSVKLGGFPCEFCNKSYTSSDQLMQHVRDKHPNEKQSQSPSPNKFPCKSCKRSYSTDGGLFDHRRTNHPDTLSQQELSKVNKSKSFPCGECTDSFDSYHALLQHQEQKHIQLEQPVRSLSISSDDGSSSEHVCTTCFKTFDTKVSAAQHLSEKKDHIVKKSTRKLAVDCFLKAAQVENDDRQESVKVFTDVLKRIMEHVRSTKDGKIYSPSVRRAGSTAVNVKIGKADEFDTNIPLNITPKHVITDGSIYYLYEDKLDLEPGEKVRVNMNVDRKLKSGVRTRIPEGQAVVKVDSSQIPSHLLHGDDLIPHKCQKDLYNRVKMAIEDLKLTGVNLSREAHGPAITLTIMPPNGHYISVDLTMSLDCGLKLSNYGWPRESTKRAFSIQKISECLKTPLHLVPKGGETWSISFSLVEETFLNGIDAGNECRRRVMQIMKRHLQICSSRKGLEGISSYIVKQQLMWSAEAHNQEGYWHQENIDTCVIDVIGDFLNSLKQGRLLGFFNMSVNILEHKKRSVLNALVRYFEEEKLKLERME